MTKHYQKYKKIQLPLMEEVLPNTLYTCTINMSHLINKTMTYYDHSYKLYLTRHIKPYMNNYMFYPELSTVGKYHIHGTVNFKSDTSIINFYKNACHLQGTACIEIDTIDNIQKWMDYILKQKRFHKILDKHYNITPFYKHCFIPDSLLEK